MENDAPPLRAPSIGLFHYRVVAAARSETEFPTLADDKRPEYLLTTTAYNNPQKLHLDRRADTLAQQGGFDDELITGEQLAEWFGCSIGWVNLGRHKGYGPPYLRLGPNTIRYNRGAVKMWLRERSYTRTGGYSI